jgi:hypothetical protein
VLVVAECLDVVGPPSAATTCSYLPIRTIGGSKASAAAHS